MSSNQPAAGVTGYVCDMCGQGLTSSAYLARHKSKVHGSTYFGCSVAGCDFATTRQDSLNNHLRSHGIAPAQNLKFVHYSPPQ
ncbi:SubName: Full=Uncharacterized protein {ECO:0000313/EMBL:CCA70400.1} [Serendipita indica DSM 11827]|uniref:C2H2-type domain-containing protein n=1 Tax=Serendipita indica (strain DSM 11827) TaxID=1109443 RepID=G4TGF0_SERID|nr:SubName: Full=Uncharacterized protein {ECO:0000313/EMBL:CCA70400.1} [Serendipita indica DSM 11827]CCA70400.1 hypothetical protein PIIN_04339 [Serendipita indica DSM 11827]